MTTHIKNVLVTGGAGYIGSHAVIELIEAGYRPVVLDNLSNSSAESLKRVASITGVETPFIEADIADAKAVKKLIREYQIHAVIHFAGFKAVGESVEQPLQYYQNNVAGTLSLIQTLAECNVTNLVFSSSATVYGDPKTLPINEQAPLSSTNPYGASKLMVENILRDLQYAQPQWNISILRYFNPVGAHSSGLIGEDPNGIPNNLMPYIAQVAVGKRAELSVFGGDYPTPDGTGVRDYIHVVDLAKGHISALAKLEQNPGCITHNLGTGQGYSVLDMVKAMEASCGKGIAYQIVPRRTGDIATCYADPERAATELNWRATHTIEDMCNDTWRWQSNNPDGYS